jgi:hypothetical protein
LQEEGDDVLGLSIALSRDNGGVAEAPNRTVDRSRLASHALDASRAHVLVVDYGSEGTPLGRGLGGFFVGGDRLIVGGGRLVDGGLLIGGDWLFGGY